MLEIIGITTDGESLSLSPPSYLALNCDEDVPADDLSLVIEDEEILPELRELILTEDGVRLFYGTVDEQQLIITPGRISVKLVARSMAALLLDNEAKPVDFYCPSASVIFDRFASPCGIRGFKGADKVYRDRLNIPKGVSCYQAVCSFASAAFGKTPRIDEYGDIDFNGTEKSETVVFSNDEGVRYTLLRENRKRCKLISDIRVKIAEGDGYIYRVENAEARKKGVVRTRYLDASGSVSALTAEKMLENSHGKYYELILKCPGSLPGILGANAVLRGSPSGDREGLYVSALSYVLKPDGDYTTVRLKRVKSNVDF